MRRREFITLFGGAAAAGPLAARAQHSEKLPAIGFLGSTTPSAESQRTAAFVQRLRELGWIEGRTIAIEYRWGESRPERFAEIAAEFVRLKVDVMIAGGTPTALAAKRATTVVPIVFAMTGDPVGTGLVAHLARPGGNLTGLSTQTTDTVSKRIELLREVVPNLRRLAILANIDSPVVVLEMGEAQAAARAAARADAEYRCINGRRRGRSGSRGTPHGIPAGARSAGVVGGPQCPHRLSLWGQQSGPLSVARQRAGSSTTRCALRNCDTDRRGISAGNSHDPDRIRQRLRSGRLRSGREPGAAGRQSHRLATVRGRDHRQMAGNA